MLNIPRTRDLLQKFDFKKLFIEELGWSNPASAAARQAEPFQANGETFQCRQIAQLAGVVVMEVSSPADQIPDAKARIDLHREIEKHHHEHLLIFIGQVRTQSLWYWVKHVGQRHFPRDHYYSANQPGDLFLSKLSGIVVDISELDRDGNVPVTEVASRLQRALDVERTTKKFFREYDALRLDFVEMIEGIDEERDRRWYTSVLLNRLMFVYFLQRKFFIDNGDGEYLQHKLAQSRQKGKDRYYGVFLKALFFDGLAKPETQHTDAVQQLLGAVKYLNGGLFLPHVVETRWPKIRVPDAAFEQLFELFGRYSWNLNDTPGGNDNEINPDVLGYIFEKYINQKEFGAYYTRPQITDYLCERTIHRVILNKVNAGRDVAGLPAHLKQRSFTSMAELLMNLDADLCKRLLHDILPKLSLLDPACGSGAFLVAAMKALINIYAAVIGRIDSLSVSDTALKHWLKDVKQKHPSIAYYIRKQIITENLYGVDIMEEATEIARLRLFLALVACADDVSQLEPLPNIDFNILTGNSLIGLLRVDEDSYAQRTHDMFSKPYAEVVAEKNRLVETYRHTATYAQDLGALRDEIDQHRTEAMLPLNEMLLAQFTELGIKYEQATWDAKNGAEGRPLKRAVQIKDIEALKPFHWGYEFDDVMNRRGGFDIIITNPPWEIFKPQAKEFFAEYSDIVTKNKMTIKEFEKEQGMLLAKADIRAAWLAYRSRFPHVNQYYRAAPQYANQTTVINGKKAGSDINFYKLFTEQCENLLRPGGQCGIVIPSGIYTDLGAKQLREMLFAETRITGLFCFENRKEIFENVDSRFKFVVLTFEKGGSTSTFPAAFMRHEVSELERFPQEGALQISIDLVRKLAPDSLSIVEFKSDLDVQIAEKMLRFPLLGEQIDNSWNLVLKREFHMTDDSGLFNDRWVVGRLPLYEGKMIHQFDAHYAEPRYWVDEKEGRIALLGKDTDTGQRLDYQAYRLAFRDVAASTNERTMISTVLPPYVFCPHTMSLENVTESLLSHKTRLALCAILNSYAFDYQIRSRVTSHLSFYYLNGVPLPRLADNNPQITPIVERAAKLICTTPEFDDLAKEVGLGSHANGVTDPAGRARLRAELDGLVAHLYELTEDEFRHILAAFPLVDESVKVAALEAYLELGK